MFWESVIGGLKVLVYWETYVSASLFLAIILIPSYFVGKWMETSDAEAPEAFGCIYVAVIMPIIQMAGVLVFVLILHPIILGIADDAAWNFPLVLLTSFPGTFAKLLLYLIVATIVLAFVPFLGQLHSLHAIVLGGIVLNFVIQVADAGELSFLEQIDFVPGFWFIVGILVFGAILSWATILILAFLSSGLGFWSEETSELLAMPSGLVAGYIPLFIYGAWLGQQFQELAVS